MYAATITSISVRFPAISLISNPAAFAPISYAG